MLQQVRSGSVLILHMPERGALTKGEKMQSPKKVLPGNSIEKCPTFLFRQLDCCFFLVPSWLEMNEQQRLELPGGK